jgi:hypothetical protein
MQGLDCLPDRNLIFWQKMSLGKSWNAGETNADHLGVTEKMM